VAITNLTLQKLLYFAHGMYLASTGSPLVGGYFEAWTYGPVHPQVYGAFKRAKNGAIHFRAVRKDYVTGTSLAVAPITSSIAKKITADVVGALGKLPTTRLVALSHAADGPWHIVVNEARTHPGLGLRISDMLIATRFGMHKLPVHGLRHIGEDPGEETPLAG
jgi:uncharacterized phage-associated protein